MKKNVFEIETVALMHYHNIKDIEHYAELVLIGDVENIDQHLYIFIK